MRKFLCVVVLCVVAGTAAFAEEAAVIPAYNLRLSQNYSVGLTGDGGNEPSSVTAGYGAEYATSDWLNLQLLWNSGLKVSPDPGLGSLFFGLKSYIVGDGALASARWLRLSLALGILIPPRDKRPDLFDQDQNLWGSSLRLYTDFVFSKYFYLNLFFEGDFYPPQQVDNDVYYGNWARHYLDVTGELEPHVVIPLNDKYVLKIGAPVRFFYAPWMNASDEYADSQYLLTAGGYVGLTFPAHNPPGEIYLKYNAHVLGQNIKQIHRVSLISKVTLSREHLKLKSRRKS